MKIIYLGYNSFDEHKRGVENVIDFQSQSLGFENKYYLHWGNNKTVKKNNNFICISIKHCWYFPIIINIIIGKLKKRNGNNIIVHSHNYLYTFFSLFKTHLFTVHDGLYYLNSSKKRKITLHFKLIEKIVYKRVKTVHFISNYSKQQSLFGTKDNFVIIPNTSHFEHYKQDVIPNINVFGNAYLNVLIVRSIEERARIDLLLEVAQKQIGIYNFIVAGKGPLLENYREIIREKRIDNVILLGYVEDKKLLMLYANCDLVLMIAEYGEGFGLPIIEGYLFNKPVIASNKCAIPEVIISKEYLFENNPESIIQSLKFASDNLHNNYRDYYDRNFSNAVVLSKFKDLYSNTII